MDTTWIAVFIIYPYMFYWIVRPGCAEFCSENGLPQGTWYDPLDCGKYYQCGLVSTIHHTCPPGTVFKQTGPGTGICEFVYNADCSANAVIAGNPYDAVDVSTINTIEASTELPSHMNNMLGTTTPKATDASFTSTLASETLTSNKHDSTSFTATDTTTSIDETTSTKSTEIVSTTPIEQETQSTVTTTNDVEKSLTTDPQLTSPKDSTTSIDETMSTKSTEIVSTTPIEQETKSTVTSTNEVEKSYTDPQWTSSRARAHCFGGDIHWDTSCYRMLPNPQTYNGSLLACQTINSQSTLVSIQTDDEMYQLQALFPSASDNAYDEYWIGLHDFAPGNNITRLWTWVDGTPLPTNAIFWDSPNNPNGFSYTHPSETVQDCVAVIGNLWQDRSCGETYQALCEYPDLTVHTSAQTSSHAATSPMADTAVTQESTESTFVTTTSQASTSGTTTSQATTSILTDLSSNKGCFSLYRTAIPRADTITKSIMTTANSAGRCGSKCRGMCSSLYFHPGNKTCIMNDQVLPQMALEEENGWLFYTFG